MLPDKIFPLNKMKKIIPRHLSKDGDLYILNSNKEMTNYRIHHCIVWNTV